MNTVILMGRLTKDPEVKVASTGKKFARYSLAVNRTYKREGQPEADFFNISVLNEKGAEFVEKYLHKGTKVVVSGSIQNNNYEKDGVKHYSVEIVQNSVEFAESKAAAATNATPADAAAAAPTPAPQDIPEVDDSVVFS